MKDDECINRLMQIYHETKDEIVIWIFSNLC